MQPIANKTISLVAAFFVVLASAVGVISWKNVQIASKISPTQNPSVNNQPPSSIIVKAPQGEDHSAYFAYLKNETFKSNDESKSKYILVEVREDGNDKKILFIHTRNAAQEGHAIMTPQSILNRNTILLRRINCVICSFEGEGGADIEDGKLLNKTGEDTFALELSRRLQKKGIIRNVPEDLGNIEISSNKKLVAYIKSNQQRDPYTSPTTIGVLNLDTDQEKIYALDKNYSENGPTLHFSPDSKALYACGCIGFYFRGPSVGVWKIDLETWKVDSLEYISKLNFRDAEFVGDFVYVASYEEYDKESYEKTCIADCAGPPQRSKTLYKIDLKQRTTQNINFKNYFTSFGVSTSRQYILFRNLENQVMAKNQETGEEFLVPNVEGIGYLKEYLENNKLPLLETRQKDGLLYIYDLSSRSKKLIETFSVGHEYIQLIGWIH